ncbi:MAG: BrnT family toxin, partial [Thermomicrobia bacterium]|nr:BrnT family toxin [Thermomicrobia bacterium]
GEQAMVWFSELIWDDWNEEHIARHGVRMSEATEAVRNAPFLTRARDETYRVIGQTDAGRYLFIIVVPQILEAYYVVTARDATRNERCNMRRH